ncbi:hypothetical protein FG379_001723 [Cryptosporidium bovis]|uniref:uncharacterized protein n=1 Tax=Cryptosporidium bovis TaxID=310047 RepID=UPI003519EDFA|nr:hypothetical protein FG379_001723 [Cryptosporidium bovis]
MSNCELHSEDEYLILVNGDEYFTEKGQNGSPNFNSSNYYVYKKGEFLSYDPENRNLYTKRIINEFIKIRELVEEVNSNLLKTLLGISGIVDESEVLKKGLKLDKQLLINELLKIKELVNNYICNGFDSFISFSKLGELIREKIKVVDLVFEKVRMEESEEIERLKTFKGDLLHGDCSNKGANLGINSIKIESSEENLGRCSIDFANQNFQTGELNNLERESSDSDKESSEDSNSYISHKSEPIIYGKIEQNLFRKSGTVINAGAMIDDKKNKEKHQRLLESYRNISIGNEIKENMNTNKL